MRGIGFSHGYLHWTPGYGIRILENTESKMWDTGYYDRRNIRIGLAAFTMVNPIIRPCFVTEIRGSGRPTSGMKPHPSSSEGIANQL